MDRPPAIGIDLGTTNSCVAVMRHGKVKIIPNEQGEYVTPSYVSFNEHERVVGYAAKNATLLNPKNTVFDAKRLIGRKWNDSTVQNDVRHWPFRVEDKTTGPHIEVTFKGEKKLFLPEQISAMVLEKMKEIAEKYLNQTVTDAVITVPAYFNDGQRQATIDAGRIAGLNVVRIINEPTAAAIAFAHKNHDYMKEGTNILVFDLGGGTFDVTILRVEKDCITVKASNGNTQLGGEDFDCRLVDFCVENFERKHHVNLRTNAGAMRRLRSACEKAKRDLTSTTHTQIVVDRIHDGIDLSMTILRRRFEEINADMLKQTLIPVQLALDDAKLKKADIHKIVLVGGSTRIPMLQRLLSDFFDGKALDRTIDADKAVAYGAAIQADALLGHTPDKILGRLLRDVTPLSLGVGSKKGFVSMFVVIPRNTLIPAKVTEPYYTTVHDNQERIAFPIRQGESSNALENCLLGEFVLTGFPIAPKGVPKIAVTFQINANGILTVTARDRATGSTNGIKIENVTGRLKKEQIERMIEEAENYRREDENRKNQFQAVVALEVECFEIKAKLLEHGGRVPELEKAKISKECDDVLIWVEQNLFEAEDVYERRRNELRNMAQKILDKNKNKAKGIVSSD